MEPEAQEPEEESDPELKRLDREIARLVAEEGEVSALRAKIHDRLASFPNDASTKQEAELSARRVELHAEIDRLREEREQRRLELESGE
jgi:uncharacterized protein YdaU (DUF1376 family)